MLIRRRNDHVVERELNWKFAEDFVVEPAAVAEARRTAQELGVDCVSPATGAQLAVLAATLRARTMIEIGTGVGVSGLRLLAGAPEAHLTSIDVETDHQQHARKAFTEAGVAANRVRLISGRALDVLPRMNEESYDLVLVDADGASVIEYVEHSLRLARPGGLVVVTHALWHGRVADPVRREDVVLGIRGLLGAIAESEAVFASLSPIGDGLLQLSKRGD
jgi:predicted O-methyltransferase YrrM